MKFVVTFITIMYVFFMHDMQASNQSQSFAPGFLYNHKSKKTSSSATIKKQAIPTAEGIAIIDAEEFAQAENSYPIMSVCPVEQSDLMLIYHNVCHERDIARQEKNMLASQCSRLQKDRDSALDQLKKQELKVDEIRNKCTKLEEKLEVKDTLILSHNTKLNAAVQAQQALGIKNMQEQENDRRKFEQKKSEIRSLELKNKDLQQQANKNLKISMGIAAVNCVLICGAMYYIALKK